MNWAWIKLNLMKDSNSYNKNIFVVCRFSTQNFTSIHMQSINLRLAIGWCASWKCEKWSVSKPCDVNEHRHFHFENLDNYWWNLYKLAPFKSLSVYAFADTCKWTMFFLKLSPKWRIKHKKIERPVAVGIWHQFINSLKEFAFALHMNEIPPIAIVIHALYMWMCKVWCVGHMFVRFNTLDALAKANKYIVWNKRRQRRNVLIRSKCTKRHTEEKKNKRKITMCWGQ